MLKGIHTLEKGQIRNIGIQIFFKNIKCNLLWVIAFPRALWVTSLRE